MTSTALPASSTLYGGTDAAGGPNSVGSTEPQVKVVARRSRRNRRTTEPGIQDAAWWKPSDANTLENTNERAPLLQHDLPITPPASTAQILREEVVILAGYALPAFITHFLEYSILMAPIISIGHLSTTALAAGTLASMTASVTGLTIAHSFASALDTILPPAWTSGDPTLVGLWTQRMLIIMTLLDPFIIGVWLNAEPILLYLRQDPDVAHLAAIYLRYLSLGLPAFTFNAVLRRYFQCQGLFTIPTQIIVVVAPLNAALDYLLVWGPPWIRLGFIGGPLATAFSFNLILVLSIIYAFCLPDQKAWRPLTWQSFQRLGILVYLGIAGIGQIATEWWAWEIVNLAASLFGKTSLAAQSVLLVSCTTTYQAPYSIALGAAVRIGNLLGEYEARRAKLVSRLAFALSIAVGIGWCIMFVLLRRHWSLIFNDDPDVVAIVSRILPLVGLLELLDSISTVGGGVLRACGQQGTAAIVVICAYYLAGIPLGLYLAFRQNLMLLGLWLGLSLSLLTTTGFILTLIPRLDWETEAKKARERLESNPHSIHPEDVTNSGV